ncbi:MAG TPA: threonine ammonia-lyase [Caulobacterales bacterium]|nr:threonine ammonia-lyase [Caulobacterales bacterium]
MADQTLVRAKSAPPVDFDAIQAAAARLAGQIERTPTRCSRTLSQITGAEVWIKFENLQFTASFKERGALNKLLQLTPKEQKQGVIAASAGNHSLGVAYHGHRLGIPVTMVMPKSTPFVKIQQTAHFGAAIVLEGETFDDAYEHALKLCAERDLVFVHPFNDPQVIAGQGTAALEMLQDAPDLEAIVCPIGGGGLIAGIATAAKHLKPDISIIGVEPAMYPSFISRMRSNRPRIGGSTIAEGIAVKAVGDLSYSIARPLLEDVLLIEEADFERAIALYCTIEKTIAEGAGAAALSALLAYPENFRGRKVGLVLSGGNIDTRLLAAVLTRSLIRDGRIANLRFTGDDRPGLLANVSRVLGEEGANIISVEHRRYALDVPAKGAEFDIEIETRDAQHTTDIVDALIAAGYPPKRI